MGWAQWPARLQQLQGGPLAEMLPRGSELWVDGGHNPSAARLVADYARKNWTDGLPLVLLFASLVSKDAAGVLRPFKGIADTVLTLPIEGHVAAAQGAGPACETGALRLPESHHGRAMTAPRPRRGCVLCSKSPRVARAHGPLPDCLRASLTFYDDPGIDDR